MRRHHPHRALSYTLLLYRFSVWSLARGLAITGEVTDITDAGTTVATGTTAATVTGVLGITGTNRNAVAAGADCRLNDSTARFCFDFRKSRLLQLLIQRGKIGLD